MNDSSQAFENRFALFFDFLGTSHAARNAAPEKAYALVDLLKSLSLSQTEQNIDGNALEDGSYRLSVTPEITTFSDNILASYPAVPDEMKTPIFDIFWTKIVCEDCIRLISIVAEHALRIEMLVRGGLSYGQLYHQNSVSFGEAMVDAYDLESKIAGNPRILISKQVIAKLGLSQLEDSSVFLRDLDGQWHLNYFTKMAKVGMNILENRITNKEWANHHFTVIQKQVNDFRNRGDDTSLKRAAKWEWFSTSMQTAVSDIRSKAEC